nr:molybdopterin-guanine dinucleotide biosynthesis protein B [uncultured Faecalimonas sp.]
MGKNVGKPLIFAVSGYKNTGKTTLIQKIIPLLTEKGYAVAVVKHDGHEFESDVPGTDSYKHQKAGAYGTAVFSGNQFLVTKRIQEVTVEMLLSFFPEADIILIEGMKDSDYPKYVCTSPKGNAEPEEVAEQILRCYRNREGVSGE